jgi:PST family polysaccharide transporter
MNLRAKAIRGVAWSAARNWGGRAINFVVFAVLAQLLPQVAFGLVALAGTYVALVRVFVDQGFADAIIQRDDLEAGHLDTAFWANLGFAVGMMAGSIVAAPWIAQLFDSPDLGPVIQWLAPSFVLAALAGVQQAYIERALDYRVLAIREFAAALSGGLVGVGMALSGWGVWSLVGMLLAERVVAVGVLWTASDWRPGVQLSGRHFTDLFRFGVNVLGSNLLYYVNSRADNLIIGYALGPEALGFYDVAYKLFQNGLNAITLTVSSVAFSTFSRLQHARERMRQGFLTATQTVSVAAFPIFAGTAAVAPELIGLLFGGKWLPLSAQVYQLLALNGALQAVLYFNTPVLMACGKPHWRLGVGILNAVLNIALFAWAVQWGIVAVAAAFVARGYLVAPLQLALVRALIDLRVRAYLRLLITPLVGSMVLAGLLWGGVHALQPSLGRLLALLAAGLVAGGAYVGVLFAINRPLFRKLTDLVQSARA